MVLPIDYKERLRSDKEMAKNAAKRFADACKSGNCEWLFNEHYALNETIGGWPYAFRYIESVNYISPEVQEAFLQAWIETKSIASSFRNNKPLLIRGLRKLLPKYQGEQKTLYRGDFALFGTRRRIGISWTDKLSVAEQFAAYPRSCADGGSVIVMAIAPPEAIIATTDMVGDYYEEGEYLVDPKDLSSFKIVKRIQESPKDEI